MTSRLDRSRSASRSSSRWRPTSWVVSAGRRRGRAGGAGAARASSVGSSSSTRDSRSLSTGDGSTPSSSRRCRRNASAWRSASAVRPLRWSARISWSRSRSRSGCTVTRVSSSPTSSACSPSASRASRRSSRALARCSSRPTATGRAQSRSANSSKAAPCHSPSASRRRPTTTAGSAERFAREHRVSKRRASTTSSSATRTYPGGRAAMSASGRSSLRRRERLLWSTAAGSAGARSLHSSSQSRSVDTTSPRPAASRARTRRGFGPPIGRDRPSRHTSIAPSTRIWRSPTSAFSQARLQNACSACKRHAGVPQPVRIPSGRP